jgi:ketosteroid isomerase-like protein
MNQSNLNDANREVERIYKAWDAALAARDLEAALSLYAPDATIESPLVVHHLGVEKGACQGNDELRRFIRMVFERLPAERKHFRSGYFTDG